MTSLVGDVAESFAWLERIFVIGISLMFALAPLGSILGEVALVTGVDLAPPGVGFALLVGAGLLERYRDHSPDLFVVFAVATLTCWFVFEWAFGLSAQRLELAPHVLLTKILVFLAAVMTAIAVTFYRTK
ncbi:hypothetical protein [Halomontanus rarus]|uniref:hypothetical protein n=1 Tax=Halomontanus rarus TaxID=3034020 RepID=UPI001A980B74